MKYQRAQDDAIDGLEVYCEVCGKRAKLIEGIGSEVKSEIGAEQGEQ